MFLLACDGSMREPVAPNQVSPLMEAVGMEAIGPADAQARSASRGKASGHAAVQGTPVQNVSDERYSFTAIPRGDAPLATGQVDVHFTRISTGETVNVHAEVTCVSVVADQAWVGSRVTRYAVDGVEVPERVGIPMMFRVRDLGEGSGTTDLASLVLFSTTPGSDLAHCLSRPAVPILRVSATGNIQVKPD